MLGTPVSSGPNTCWATSHVPEDPTTCKEVNYVPCPGIGVNRTYAICDLATQTLEVDEKELWEESRGYNSAGTSISTRSTIRYPDVTPHAEAPYDCMPDGYTVPNPFPLNPGSAVPIAAATINSSINWTLPKALCVYENSAVPTGFDAGSYGNNWVIMAYGDPECKKITDGNNHYIRDVTYTLYYYGWNVQGFGNLGSGERPEMQFPHASSAVRAQAETRSGCHTQFSTQETVALGALGTTASNNLGAWGWFFTTPSEHQGGQWSSTLGTLASCKLGLIMSTSFTYHYAHANITSSGGDSSVGSVPWAVEAYNLDDPIALGASGATYQACLV